MTNEASGESTYVLDSESPVEMARLINQDRITTQVMGGPLAGIADPSSLRNILDLGCGPGGWVLDVAFELPDAEVEGVDISRMMVDYANARARTQQLPNASFGVMDITQPLDFPDNAFDLVNARFLVAVLPKERWTPFIAECTRVLRPGGTIRLTEPIDAGVSNSPALETIHSLLYQALWQAGYGFSVDGKTTGLSHALPNLLRTADYQNLRYLGHALDCSANTEGWMDFYHNAEVGYKLAQPFFVQAGVTTQEEIDHLYQQMLIEMNFNDFCSMWHLVTILANKSE
jgi:ubiquinone/menaquinone biosynthesis C-methylase UbiE